MDCQKTVTAAASTNGVVSSDVGISDSPQSITESNDVVSNGKPEPDKLMAALRMVSLVAGTAQSNWLSQVVSQENLSERRNHS